MELILKYFPELSEKQIRINSVSWMCSIMVGMLKSMSFPGKTSTICMNIMYCIPWELPEFTRFKSGTEIMDLGTGGGFPGIPLAIMFPDCHFHLVDSIGKKIKVCMEVARELGLENVTFRPCRAEEEKAKFDFVVSRAVMPLADLVKIIRKNISPVQHNAIPNGLICLKGGELEKETNPLKNRTMVTPLKEFFMEEYFATKKVVYVSL